MDSRWFKILEMPEFNLVLHSSLVQSGRSKRANPYFPSFGHQHRCNPSFWTVYFYPLFGCLLSDLMTAQFCSIFDRPATILILAPSTFADHPLSVVWSNLTQDRPLWTGPINSNFQTMTCQII